MDELSEDDDPQTKKQNDTNANEPSHPEQQPQQSLATKIQALALPPPSVLHINQIKFTTKK